MKTGAGNADSPEDWGRRTVLAASAALVAPALPAWAAAPGAAGIGSWAASRDGLPHYRYTGPLPAAAKTRGGEDAEEAPDPAFLIGNHRITVFTHVSGIMQIMTGDRVWARVNAADTINYGVNAARLRVDGVSHELIGLGSLAANPATARHFGCGFARHAYRPTRDVSVRRVVSVAPSTTVGGGVPAFVVSITLDNRSGTARDFDYTETIRNHYVTAGQQRLPLAERMARYPSTTSYGARVALARTRFEALQFTPPAAPADAVMHDVRPAGVFMAAEPAAGVSADMSGSTEAELAARFTGRIPARGSVTVHLVIGLTQGSLDDAAKVASELFTGGDTTRLDEGLFAAAWRRHLPEYARESDPVFRTEMTWHAHALEAMATHSAYFDETFVPQGVVYAYEDGENISNRDNLQALLPLCYTNPALARSALRHVFRQTTTTGEIKRGTGGIGYVSPSIYKESDEQLYVFMALAEYLRITGDHAILDDLLPAYPPDGTARFSVLALLQKHFVYLRDEVGLGPHGLVRILNSDWSDSFFHKYSPNILLHTAESHLNSAMALAVMPGLIAALKAARRTDIDDFVAALEAYHAALTTAYFKDLGTRDFSARAYLNEGKPSYGLDVVCLEPQGFLLQVPGLPAARKQAIYERVRAATLDPIGFRIREKPIFGGKGEAEDGGIWFALEHQMVRGVATFDKAEARRLLHRMSFANFARAYPDYWMGRWTHFDCVQSTLSEREGLLNYWRGTFRQQSIGYCSHAHSWPLYNYHRIME